MNIRDLRYIMATAKHKHFGRAADACFISQPTLSAQIKKCEERLGVQLFERTPKKVRITEMGQPIIDQIQRILVMIDELQDIADSVKSPYAGIIRIGAIPTISPYLLPHILKPSRKAMPDIQLHFTEDKTQLLIEQLKAGEIDCAVLALPIDERALGLMPLYTEPFILATPVGHQLAQQASVSIQDIDAYPLLLLQEGHCLADQTLEICKKAGKHPAIGYRTSSLETLRLLVASEHGITLLPQSACKKSLSDSLLALIPFKKPQPSREVVLVWRKANPRTACFEKLGQVIQEVSKKIL